MPERITNRLIGAVRPRATPYDIRDTQLPGFLLRVMPSGSKNYYVQLGRGKRKKIGPAGVLTLEQARTIATKYLRGVIEYVPRAEQKRAASAAKQRTLGAYLEGPYTAHQDRKRSGGETLAIIRHNFADWLPRDMGSLRRQDVVAWQRRREAEGRAHATLQRAYGALKTLLRHAARQDPPVIDKNPLEHVTLEHPTDQERGRALSGERAAGRRLLTDAEVQALHVGLDAFAEEVRAQRRNSRRHGRAYLPDLDAVSYPHWFIPFTSCAMYTGMRPGDLYALTWQELNIAAGRLVKVPEKTRHHPDPARIVMDLPPALRKIMREWWGLHGEPESGLVFPSPVTGERFDKKAHLKPWARVKRLGGLPDALTFYALRHHFISALVAAGVPVLTVARLAGHKGAAMIEKHYGHLCPTAARDALSLLAERWARA